MTDRYNFSAPLAQSLHALTSNDDYFAIAVGNMRLQQAASDVRVAEQKPSASYIQALRDVARMGGEQ